MCVCDGYVSVYVCMCLYVCVCVCVYCQSLPAETGKTYFPLPEPEHPNILPRILDLILELKANDLHEL